MSVVLASCAFWAAASYVLVGDDAKPEVVKFRCRFKRLTRTAMRELNARIAATGDIARAERGQITLTPQALDDCKKLAITDKEVLDTLLIDWDLKTKTGEALVYSEQVRAEVVEEWDGIEQAMVSAYFNAIAETAKAATAEKNSEVPSSTGP